MAGRGDPAGRMTRIDHSDEGRNMGADKTTSWSYAEAFAVEDELAYRARERSLALRIPPVTPGTAAALTVQHEGAQPGLPEVVAG